MSGIHNRDSIQISQKRIVNELGTVAGHVDNVETLLNAGLPAALDSGALKVKEQSPISGFSTSTLQGAGLPTTLTASGNLKVSVEESSAGGDASAANQVTANGHLSTIATETTSIDNKITSCDTGSVTVTSSVLPTNAATASNQTTGNTSLSSINGKMTQGYDSTVSSGGNGLQQVLAYGRDSSGNLDALNVDNNGHLKIAVDTVENKGSEGNILSNGSLNNSSTTSSLDVSDFNYAHILYEDSNTSNSNSIRVEVSEDNSHFYVRSEIYPTVYGSVRQYVEYSNFSLHGIKYIRFNNFNTGASNDLTNVYISVVGTPN